MESKETISFAKAEKEYVCYAEQGKSSRIETTRDSKVQEIRDEEVKFLGDVSTETRPKTTRSETFVEVSDTNCASSSPDTPVSNQNIEAALNAAKSALRGAASCYYAIAIARNAVCEEEKRLVSAHNRAERVYLNHVQYYLIVNKYRTIADLVSESVREAEKAKRKAIAAAENAQLAGKCLSETTRKSEIKDAELWATSATTIAKQMEIDAFKAAYAVLKSIKKFWLEVDDAIYLETSFRKSIHSSNAALQTSNVVLLITFLLACITVIIHYLKIENHLYYIIFIGCSLIMGRVLTGIVRNVGYNTDKENGVEKMKIRRQLQDIEDHMRLYDDYFAYNEISPIPSHPSEDEVSEDSHVL